MPVTLGRALSISLSGQKHRTLHVALANAAPGWELYPVYPLDDQGVCTCSKRERRSDPGKHPATAYGFNDASSARQGPTTSGMLLPFVPGSIGERSQSEK
jgi:hypothetical protein